MHRAGKKDLDWWELADTWFRLRVVGTGVLKVGTSNLRVPSSSVSLVIVEGSFIPWPTFCVTLGSSASLPVQPGEQNPRRQHVRIHLSPEWETSHPKLSLAPTP